MNILKIKIKGDEVSVDWNVPGENGSAVLSLFDPNRARPELYTQLELLADHVIEILELPDSYTKDLEVRGVSFDYKDDVMGAVITSIKKLEKTNGVFVINTPHKPSKGYGENADEGNVLSKECVKVLRKLIEECKLYIKGERAQGKLFNEEQGK